MNEAIENLYETFAHFRIGDDFVACDCCVNAEQSERLAEAPLRDLAYDDLERYSRKAITTWGNVRHFKHFLPRLLELTIDHRDEFLDLAVVFGKLETAKFVSWPERERAAVDRFFDEYWTHQLAEPIVGVFEDSIDTVLCAIACALPSVVRFLDAWTSTFIDEARRHLAAFILANDASLLKRGRLSNPFWDTNGVGHGEVIDWLQSDALVGYLEDAEDSVFAGGFEYAKPQLLAIRASLAQNHR